jgi:dTDP-D-glucose 4,6-dehydratase
MHILITGGAGFIGSNNPKFSAIEGFINACEWYYQHLK